MSIKEYPPPVKTPVKMAKNEKKPVKMCKNPGCVFIYIDEDFGLNEGWR